MDQEINKKYAPGRTGAKPRWTASTKSGVGTSLQATSHVWFTIGHGIINEMYYPEVDRAAIRDLGFVVTDGVEFFSEERSDTIQQIEWLADGVPGYHLTNEHARYRIEKQIVTDPRMNVLLQRTRFFPLDRSRDLHLYLLLAPHLCDGGARNTAWIEKVGGQRFLFASRSERTLALGCSVPFLKCSAGFVGVSDGRQDLRKNKRLTCEYECAQDGNVALVAEIDLAKSGDEFVIALGFDPEASGAAHQVRASLLVGFEAARHEYVNAWQKWIDDLRVPELPDRPPRLFKISAAILRSHQAKTYPGGSDASLSIPWGRSKGDQDRGGYHLSWPRDLVEIAGGLLAIDKTEEASCVLRFLAVRQRENGSWPQNMWVNGRRNWEGEQLDESALPVLLAVRAMRNDLIPKNQISSIRKMILNALKFILSRGPATGQDRWENTAGYSPYTIATEVAALIEGADIIAEGDALMAEFLRETADAWNDNIEHWCYVTGTALAEKIGVPGYYLRITPAKNDGSPDIEGMIPVSGRGGNSNMLAKKMVSVDALALVRFGVRPPDDPRILNTIRAIDSILKIETPTGPCWHRYNHDHYGEHSDGSDFDGCGIGRAWPLLTGERAHYELAAGNDEGARELLHAMESFAGEGGMLPEQIWDSRDIPERELFFGRPSGSAMPLAWAHAEYLKLCRSLNDGEVNDMPAATKQRYVLNKKRSTFAIWRMSDKIESVPAGKDLRIELHEPAIVRWSVNFSKNNHETQTKDSKLGIHFADLQASEFLSGSEVKFTFYWHRRDRWEGRDFRVCVRDEAKDQRVELSHQEVYL